MNRILAALALAALADHPVVLAVEREDQVDLHLLRAKRDQLVVAFQACFTPQRPGDRVQQRRFAGAVFA